MIKNGFNKSRFFCAYIFQNIADTINAVYTGFKVLNNENGSRVPSYWQPNNSDFQNRLSQQNFEEAALVLQNNAGRIAVSVATHKAKVFAQYAKDDRSNILFYMPTPERSAGKSIIVGSGLKVGKYGVKLAFGGHATRFFGIGFIYGKTSSSQNQLFRMDWKVSGVHYPGDKDNLDYWKDTSVHNSGYEFHVPTSSGGK